MGGGEGGGRGGGVGGKVEAGEEGEDGGEADDRERLEEWRVEGRRCESRRLGIRIRGRLGVGQG